jgi:hypothetical protein
MLMKKWRALNPPKSTFLFSFFFPWLQTPI